MRIMSTSILIPDMLGMVFWFRPYAHRKCPTSFVHVLICVFIFVFNYSKIIPGWYPVFLVMLSLSASRHVKLLSKTALMQPSSINKWGHLITENLCGYENQSFRSHGVKVSWVQNLMNFQWKVNDEMQWANLWSGDIIILLTIILWFNSRMSWGHEYYIFFLLASRI